MNTILFGFKRCGKSRLGRLLAAKLKQPFIDTDQLIEELYGMNCRTIYKEKGEPFFRALEHKVIASLQPVESSVIALGGGAILQPQNLPFIEQLGKLIYLRAPKEMIKHRWLFEELPALLDPADPEGSFERLYAERLPQYESISALRINIDQFTDEEVWQAIH